MPRLTYKSKKFGPDSLAIIDQAVSICAEYQRAGYDLTLRQLYYQFVARGIILNKQSEYKRLGGIINDARLAGLIDWSYLIDRTRNIEERGHWEHPRDIIEAVADQFHVDYWKEQPVHPEVWVEKEALAGVVEGVTHDYDVTSLACRGYMSQSEQWGASQRFLKHIKRGQRVVIIHLGDHDPSGVDMSRDNADRIELFLSVDLMREAIRLGYGNITPSVKGVFDWAREHYGIGGDFFSDPLFELRRIALNMDQIEQYDPPPNFAKITDSRAKSYIEEYGEDSWELDALPPDVLSTLISEEIETLMDEDAFADAKAKEIEYRNRIHRLLAEHGDLLDINDDTDIDD